MYRRYEQNRTEPAHNSRSSYEKPTPPHNENNHNHHYSERFNNHRRQAEPAHNSRHNSERTTSQRNESSRNNHNRNNERRRNERHREAYYREEQHPKHNKNPIFSFIPSSLYNPENGKILGFLTAEDLLIIALIIMFLDSDEEGDNLMVYALLYVLASEWLDLDFFKKFL